MTGSIRVLVVDDHPVVRAGVTGMLLSDDRFTVVGEAEDGLRALVAVRDLAPDVVLVDLRMPRMDGVEAIRSLTRDHPGVNALVMTTYDTDADILRAIEAGATGYLLKDAPREELYLAIEHASRGAMWLSPSVASRVVRQATAPPGTTLSGREIEVLRHVARGAGNKEIAAMLSISEATIKTHLLHIYRKLDVDGRTAAVTVALERGLISL